MSSKSTNLYKQLAEEKLFNKSVNFDLKRIKFALKLLDNPERKLKKVINILGSDGKYSVLTCLKYFIEANGERTSAYISPSLRTIRERFWMGNDWLSYSEIKKTINIIKRLKVRLTVFEVLTVIFIVNAAKRKNDYNLIEAGALFAKDSTNVFDFPLMQVVVNINKQHLNFVKRKNLSEIIKQKVYYLSNYSKIYISKQEMSNLKKIKYNLRNNLSKITYPNEWKIFKKDGYFYKDKNNHIKISNKFIKSDGLFNNLGMAIKIALDLGIKKKLIEKTIPIIKFEGRLDYLNKGKLKKKLHKNEKLLVDGCHSQISGKNLSNYLRKLNIPKYGVWSFMKQKEPDVFIKEFKGVFKKIITLPINGQKNCESPKKLKIIAKKYGFVTLSASSIEKALKMISNEEKKIICFFGSLYQAGNILNKN